MRFLLAAIAQRFQKLAHGQAVAFPGAFRAALALAVKPSVEMGFDGHGLQRLADVRPLHNVFQDFAGLGFGEIAAPGELGRALVFHCHGQSSAAVFLLGAAENPPANVGRVSRLSRLSQA